MNTSVMNHDVHSPIFIRAKSANDKPQTAKPARSIDWRRIIELTLLLSLVVGAVYLIAKLVTPQVVTVIGIFVGFLVLRFVVKTILQITFTILGYLFWLAILAAILICIF
ncbi:hypothetical protein [Porphyromonas loveana]|uniref:hypothetical protein n=1 Tax=Porphyromonas loveana TaxID=1884669 RepID=UPI0035A0AAC4